MELEKLGYYPTPEYPTGKEFHELEKLTQYMPRRWRADHLVGRVLLLAALSGLGPSAMVADDDIDGHMVGTAQLWPMQPTEADACWILQRYRRAADTPTLDTAAMPIWHSPEDWERDVEEYRTAHPNATQLSLREALTILADWLHK